MASLVADYSGSSSESDGSSDSSSASSSDEPSDSEAIRSDQKNVSKLPKPNFENSSSKNSVFTNPFAEEENAKKAILEKHVKMVPTKDKVQMINGKKICWNYRKGRCRFGHKCTFAHDSDLYDVGDNEKDNKQNPASNNEEPNNQTGSSSANQNQQETTQLGKSKKRKKPGLSDNLIPSKKVLKMYKQNATK